MAMTLHERLLVISPHLDDAVLSCGLLLATRPAALVCTVFAGAPSNNMTTDWDQASGFPDAFTAMSTRKTEDVHALALLGAHPIHLPFRDAQYHQSPPLDSLAAALAQTVTKVDPVTVVIPLGLFHSDHKLVADACLAMLRGIPAPSMYVYEDVPYRRIPGVVQSRLGELARRGYAATPEENLGAQADARHRQMKQAAIGAYESQLRAFGPDGRAGLVAPERYWQLRDKGRTAGMGEWRSNAI